MEQDLVSWIDGLVVKPDTSKHPSFCQLCESKNKWTFLWLPLSFVFQHLYQFNNSLVLRKIIGKIPSLSQMAMPFLAELWVLNFFGCVEFWVHRLLNNDKSLWKLLLSIQKCYKINLVLNQYFFLISIQIF